MGKNGLDEKCVSIKAAQVPSTQLTIPFFLKRNILQLNNIVLLNVYLNTK